LVDQPRYKKENIFTVQEFTEFKLRPFVLSKNNVYIETVREVFQMNDTTEHTERILIEGYRSMAPWEKMKRVSELNKAAQQLALTRIRTQYGNIPEKEQRLRLASLWLSREIMIRLFGWDPEIKGY
jgi:hypothetical protein